MEESINYLIYKSIRGTATSDYQIEGSNSNIKRLILEVLPQHSKYYMSIAVGKHVITGYKF